MVVALRKESVDRNVDASLLKASKTGSLSARRAWIEIENTPKALCMVGSLSARRAWIEIVPFRGHDFWPRSLSARRAWIEIGLDFGRR